MVELTYRDLLPDDADQLHAIVSDWAVVRQLGGWPWPADQAFTRSRCKPYDGDGFVWAVCADGTLCGTLGITNGDIGYMYHPAFGGQGIAGRAATAAITHAFATTKRDVLTGSTWWDNPASYRVLQKLGFVHWQTRYVRAKARGLPTPCNELRLTRADWDRLRSTAQ
ncbi:MAG: GNAT family N-acetyltransferase [Pseudomonadota bacterium]